MTMQAGLVAQLPHIDLDDLKSGSFEAGEAGCLLTNTFRKGLYGKGLHGGWHSSSLFVPSFCP